MRNFLKQHLHGNNGDVYIEMLICTTVMLLISVIIIGVASSINTKLWLDEQLNDIVKLVETTGCTQSQAISNIENAIIEKLGGEITYEGNLINVKNKNGQMQEGCVQLNETITIRYYCSEFKAVNIAPFPISTEINLTKAATSNVYFKIDTRN